MRIPDRVVRFVFKPLVFLASLSPVAWLVWAGLTGNLSANPLSDLTNETGVWTLRFLCITLAITPVRRLSGWNGVIKFRRMAGLFAFFYGTLHFLTYVIADRFASLDFPNGIVAWTTVQNLVKSVGEDIYKRPFITVGFTAWSTMVPLTAIPSSAALLTSAAAVGASSTMLMVRVAGLDVSVPSVVVNVKIWVSLTPAVVVLVST